MFSIKSALDPMLRTLASRWLRTAPLALLASTIGCASGHDLDSMSVEQLGLSVQDIRGEVNPGEHGPEVRVIYEYLRHYGYFPNSELEKQFPYWAPLVPDAPEDPAVYGAELEEAAARYQVFMGLEPTGRIDRETLDMMKRPRCGHPENEFANRDPSEQWSTWGKWNKSTITYRVTTPGSSAGNGLTATSVGNALTGALTAWQGVTSLTLNKITTGTPDTEIKFWAQGTPPTAANWLVSPALFVDFAAGDLGRSWNQNQIGLNNNGVNWALPPPIGSAIFDIQTTLTHEIGHTLGLNHSSAPVNGTQPIMLPSLPPGVQAVNLPIQTDDRQAASLLYQLWQAKPGFALDIAAGGAPNAPKVYATSGNNTLFFWTFNNTAPNFGSWTQVAANAVAIAVDDGGFPWAVSSDGTIWRGSNTNPTLPACPFDIPGSSCFMWIAKSFLSGATDIAAGGGQVWIVSKTAVGSADFTIQKLQGNQCAGQGGTGCSWNSTNNGVGKRIAVDWLGRPYVVQSTGAVWRFYAATGANINVAGTGAATWKQLKQLNPPAQGQFACANDIGAGLDHSVWVIGCDPIGTNFDVFIWDEQIAQGTQIAEGQFMPTDGFGTRITASPDGRPWATQANTSIWRRSPRTNTP